jgi:hypothetical protein
MIIETETKLNSKKKLDLIKVIIKEFFFKWEML